MSPQPAEPEISSNHIKYRDLLIRLTNEFQNAIEKCNDLEGAHNICAKSRTLLFGYNKSIFFVPQLRQKFNNSRIQDLSDQAVTKLDSMLELKKNTFSKPETKMMKHFLRNVNFRRNLVKVINKNGMNEFSKITSSNISEIKRIAKMKEIEFNQNYLN